MSKIMASPMGLKWLSTGLEAPLGSAQAVKAGVMLTAFLNRERAAETNQQPAAK